MQLENSTFMLKREILQKVEVIACVFWAPGFQELAMPGKQISWSVHWACIDPTSSGLEQTALVCCGTMAMIFHGAGRDSILTEVQCHEAPAVLCWGPELVPPPRAVWCSVDGLVCSVVPRSHKLYRHHLSQTMSPPPSENQMPPPSHQKKNKQPQQPDIFTTSPLKSVRQ